MQVVTAYRNLEQNIIADRFGRGGLALVTANRYYLAGQLTREDVMAYSAASVTTIIADADASRRESRLASMFAIRDTADAKVSYLAS